MSALLRTKRIAWGAILFFAVLVLSFSYVSGRKYMNALEWVEHTQAVTMSLERVLSGLRDQESAMRGYVITGDKALLTARDAGRRELEGELVHLSSLVRDNQDQRARATELAKLVREKLTFMARAVALREHGSAQEWDALLASRRGKIMMDRVRFSVGMMQTEEGRLLERRRAAAAAIQRETMAAIGGVALVLVVLLVTSFLTMQRDATELRRAAAELADSEERYRVLVDNVSDLVSLHAQDGKLIYVSPSITPLLGYERSEADTLFPALLHPEDVGVARYNLEQLNSGEVQAGVLTCRVRRRDGEYRWFEFRVTRVDDENGRFRHLQSAGRDVTLRRQLEQRLAAQAEELRNLSLRDGLTGLYNRRGFLELSGQLVRVAERESHRLAILFVDLDGLKEINDRFGHAHGDRAIVEMADLLRSTCRATDLVARLGGDEFVVLAANIDDDSLGILTGRLERALAEANQKFERDYRLSFSLGSAAFDPKAPVPIETLLGEADQRMYEAKARRKQPRSRPATSPLAGVA